MPLLTKKTFTCVAVIMMAVSCKEKYLPSITSPNTGYLVVEGFINSGAEPTNITLSRTTKLYDSVAVIYEHNAEVSIEGENNETFPLFESGNGTYTSPSLNLNANQKYHLQIKTSDGKQYASDFSKVLHTPPIDSLSWTRENGGVKVYVNTHDPLNNTRYYHWKYQETWEFHSAYFSSLEYTYDQNNIPYQVVYRKPDQRPDSTIYQCWNDVRSTNINLGSSEKLSADIIYLPLVYIAPASVKLSVLYRINVRQYALSHEAYLFFQKIKKNTEGVGSIFDPQPSDLQGNIHCTSNPSEVVVGYVEVSDEKQKFIFIRNDELTGWNYRTSCADAIIDNQRDSIIKYGVGLHPTLPYSMGPFGSVAKFRATTEINCIDCTLTGSNVRPSFWP